MSTFKACAVIPVYNHHLQLPIVVDKLRRYDLPVILVDDGSNLQTRKALAVLDERDGVECITLPNNQGKGKAVMAGIAHAHTRGFSHALQVDADGQHDLADTPEFLAQARDNPEYLISGRPQYDDSIPPIRYYGRYLTHTLVWLETLSLSLRDSMCGFRVYPVAASLRVAQHTRIGARMDFDTDIMVRLFRAGTPSLFIPTHVRYPADGISHYRMVADNVRMAWLHLRLLAGLVFQLPSRWPRRTRKT